MSHGIRFVSGINEGLSIPLREGEEVVLGRNTTNDVILPHDGWVSGKHAVVKRQGGRFYLKDLQSTNGTFLSSERLPPKTFRPLKGLFVVGSTIFETTDHCANRFEGPVPLNDAFRSRVVDTQLLAVLEQEPCGHGILHSGYCFLAMVQVYADELAPLFAGLGLGIDISRLRMRLAKYRLFRGGEAWMNRFLELAIQLPVDSERFLTPLAQTLLTVDALPLERLQLALKDGFNMIYPILHYEATQTQWARVFDELTQPPPMPETIVDAGEATDVPGYLAPLLGVDAFWQDMADCLESGATVIITGDPGCGKTALIRLALYQKARVGLPHILSGEIGLFDPKTFFYLHSPKHMDDYILRLEGSFSSKQLTVLDHLEVLLEQTAHRNSSDRKVLRAIANTHTPLIVVAGRDTVERLGRELGNHEVFDLRNHLRPILPRIHNAMLEDFEHRLEANLREEAKRFFMNRVVAHDRYNLRMQYEFIELCLHRCRQIDVSLGKIADETTALGGVGEAVFHEVYDTWMNRPVPLDTGPETLPQKQPEPEPPVVSQVDAQTLDQIEEFFHNWVKHTYTMTLRYGDQTNSLKAQGRLDREQKLEQMKEHLVQVFGAFRSAFPAWFEEMWMKIDPDMISAELNTNNAKKLWTEYEERSRKYDLSYAEDLFHQTAKRILLAAIKQHN